jgi:SAM-dependent methyltransferase
MSAPDLAEFEAAYAARLQEGQVRWHPGAYLDFEMRPFLDRALAMSGLNLTACRVLDLGCGTGQAALYLAGRGASVTGIDCSPSAIGFARRMGTMLGVEADFRLGDLRDLSLGVFDLLLDCRFLHCVVDLQDRARVLAALRRALRTGGQLWSETMIGVPVIRSGDGYELDEAGIFWKALPGGITYAQGREQGGITLSPIRRIWPEVGNFNRELTTAGFEVIHQEQEPPEDDYSVPMLRTIAV